MEAKKGSLQYASRDDNEQQIVYGNFLLNHEVSILDGKSDGTIT